ncbi:hypothetical protein A5733_04275 [Mycobacterium sp. NS-7484]|uniref:hypothetical protein n=1 Tax=Mycobacterium sp. NS-7484 TaxID=1834161 RepID=UPI00096E0FBF|nr:hypothetical protein [Mycobacterium sp. NS-7484]OMC00333.1 hypothetical protein A5733_04275 [Mycobacterium sp. NS-7484]
MTTDEILTLLQVLHAYDGRVFDDVAIVVWTEAAHRRAWTADEAVEAVHEHYADNPERVMPGHITRIIRRNRSTNWQD